MWYVMFLPYHTGSNAVWRFMLWHVCTIMAIKLFEFEFLNLNSRVELIPIIVSDDSHCITRLPCLRCEALWSYFTLHDSLRVDGLHICMWQITLNMRTVCLCFVVYIHMVYLPLFFRVADTGTFVWFSCTSYCFLWVNCAVVEYHISLFSWMILSFGVRTIPLQHIIAVWFLSQLSTSWQRGKNHLNIAMRCHRLYIDLQGGAIHCTYPSGGNNCNMFLLSYCDVEER